jgi:hypothetical protein
MAGKFDGKAIEDGTIALKQLDSNLNSKLSGGVKVTAVDFSDANSFFANSQIVTITGSGFDANANVFLDGVVSTNVTVSNANSITFEFPNLTPRNYTLRPYFVTVQNPDGATAIIPWRAQYTSFVYAGDNSGYASGGFTVNTIDKFPFATDANATDVGDLTQARSKPCGQSSAVSGYSSGGGGPPPPGAAQNIIDKFPFASDGNATDVGDLTRTTNSSVGNNSELRGYTSGSDQISNVIDSFPFASDSNATDVGDLTLSRGSGAGQSSTIAGYVSGGTAPGTPIQSNVIDRFSFAANSNAADVGDLIINKSLLAGQSSLTHGFTSGGYRSPPAIFYSNIESFSFASGGNSFNVAFLTGLRHTASGQSSAKNGYTSGGTTPVFPNSSTNVNTIDKFPFASDANATDVGDLTQARAAPAGQQY